MSERSYCSELNPTEPMLGTADVVDVWVLLEYRPTWQAKAVKDNELSPDVQAWLLEGIARLEARGLRVRPQMVRQPEIERGDTRLLLYHQDQVHGGLLREFGTGIEGYADLTATSIDELVADSKLGHIVDGQQYFVCTNGQRDMCCARFGLPAYAKLREIVGARVWQTTHLGGHRFAPNVLTLPQGVLYGRVVPEDVETFVATVEGGQISAPHLRGRSCYPKHVQAAEGMTGQSGLRLLHVEGKQDRATVTFASRHSKVSIGVKQASVPLEVTASCGDQAFKVVYPFESG